MARKNKRKIFTFVDLFAGAGGLSEGFIRAGFTPVAYIEMDNDACYTIKTRLAYHYLKNKNDFKYYIDYLKGVIKREDLYKNVPDSLLSTVINKEISNKNLKGIFLRIKDNLKYFKKRNVDIILGGPPCQAYSVASWKKRNEKRKKISNRDQRKYLYKLYGQFLKKFKPKIFVFENVPGLYTADDGLYYKNMKKYFKSLGYEMDDRELDASNFGVIQRRRRIIVIGWKKRLEFKYPEFRIIKNRWKVEHIFSDMPKLKAGDEINCSNYTKKISNKYLMKYEIRNGLGFIPQNITRPLNKSDKKIYKLAIKKMEKGERLKNDKIPDEMRTINNIDSFLDRFKVVDKSNISHTLIAHIAKDGHHYIHPDKKQLRSISIREAARIQSFSDDHFFEGSRTSAFRQIGNAVPPIMARHIAKYIKRNINC